MSHFTVLVIGEDPEKQLACFHEFECTGVDEYIDDIDKTQEVQELIDEYTTADGDDKVESPLTSALEYHGLDEHVVTSEADIDIANKHKYGYAIVADGELIKAVRRTNPRAKWDWYVLGGRWNGLLKLKKGAKGVSGRPGLNTDEAKAGYADQARIGDVDLEGMRDDAGLRAAKRWDEVDAVCGSHPPHKPWAEFLAARDKGGDASISIEESRAAYWEQPRCVAWREAKLDGGSIFGTGPDAFLDSRADFIAAARNTALMTFAVLKDGEWYERGSMGWWGCVSNEDEEWPQQFDKLLDGLPADTLVSVYDCHI